MRQPEANDILVNLGAEPLVLSHSAAEDDHFGVDGGDGGAGAEGEVIGGVVDDFFGEFVSAFCDVEDDFGGEDVVVGGVVVFEFRGPAVAGEFVSCSADDVGGAAVGFEAAAGSAPASAAGLRGFDAEVSNFASVAVFAFEDVIAENDSASDPGAEREEDHACGAFAGPDPEFSVSGGVGVVLVDGGDFEDAFDMIANGDVFPGFEIRWIEDEPGFDVHEAGRGDTDGGDIGEFFGCGSDGASDRLAHGLEPGFLPAFRFSVHDDGRAEWFTSVVDDGRFHGGAADIKADKQWN